MLELLILDKTAESRNKIRNRLCDFIYTGSQSVDILPRISVKTISVEELSFQKSPKLILLGSEILSKDRGIVSDVKTLFPNIVIVAWINESLNKLFIIEDLARLGVADIFLDSISANEFFRKLIILVRKTNKKSNSKIIIVDSGKGGSGVTSIVSALGEIYLDKDDNITYTWNVDDQVVIGDSNPKWRGTLGLNAGYKGFTCSLVASYRWGGDIYNTTLIDRVENVTGYGNMDKRVFDTWTQPGDHSPYRQVLMLETPTTMMGFTSTKPTSRFVQKNNELYMSSLSVGYDFYRQSWLRKVGLQRLKLDFYVDELVRLSSIQIERGTSYPFARTFSFSVNATF